jgi:hypothetical protein
MSKLLELSVDNDGSAFAAKSKGKKKKEFKCWNCDKPGHFEDDCRQSRSENQGGKSHRSSGKKGSNFNKQRAYQADASTAILSDDKMKIVVSRMKIINSNGI